MEIGVETELGKKEWKRTQCWFCSRCRAVFVLIWSKVRVVEEAGWIYEVRYPKQMQMEHS